MPTEDDPVVYILPGKSINNTLKLKYYSDKARENFKKFEPVYMVCVGVYEDLRGGIYYSGFMVILQLIIVDSVVNVKSAKLDHKIGKFDSRPDSNFTLTW